MSPSLPRNWVSSARGPWQSSGSRLTPELPGDRQAGLQAQEGPFQHMQPGTATLELAGLLYPQGLEGLPR